MSSRNQLFKSSSPTELCKMDYDTTEDRNQMHEMNQLVAFFERPPSAPIVVIDQEIPHPTFWPYLPPPKRFERLRGNQRATVSETNELGHKGAETNPSKNGNVVQQEVLCSERFRCAVRQRYRDYKIRNGLQNRTSIDFLPIPRNLQYPTFRNRIQNGEVGDCSSVDAIKINREWDLLGDIYFCA